MVINRISAGRRILPYTTFRRWHMTRRTNRRDFLKHTGLAGVGVWIAGTNVRAISKSPNAAINIACIGVGGKGGSDTDQAGTVGNIVALCDIDDNFLENKAKQFPKAKKY